MAERSPEPVKTFSIGFEHERFDELPHARRIAQRFGTEHQEFIVRADAIEIAAEDRPPLRRALRGLLGDPELLPRRADAPARDRRPQRRRRRRVLRAATRATSPTPLAGAPGPRAGAAAPRARRALGAPAARRRRRLQRRSTAPAASPARWRSTRRRATPRYVSWSSTPRSARALYTPRVRGGDRAGAAGRRDRRAPGPRPPATSVVDMMLEVDVVHLPRRRPDREDRHRDDGPRARGALAVPRPRADGARRLDPRRPEGPRVARRSGSCARRCAGGCRTRSSTAPSRASPCRCRAIGCATTCAAGRARSCSIASSLDRGYFEPKAVRAPARPPRGRRRRRGQRIWALLDARALAARVRRPRAGARRPRRLTLRSGGREAPAHRCGRPAHALPKTSNSNWCSAAARSSRWGGVPAVAKPSIPSAQSKTRRSKSSRSVAASSREPKG